MTKHSLVKDQHLHEIPLITYQLEEHKFQAEL